MLQAHTLGFNEAGMQQLKLYLAEFNLPALTTEDMLVMFDHALEAKIIITEVFNTHGLYPPPQIRTNITY
jgi:hypothetical protein